MILIIVISCLSSGPHRYVLLVWQQQQTVNMESPKSRSLQINFFFNNWTFAFLQILDLGQTQKIQKMGQVGCFKIMAMLFCCLLSGHFEWWPFGFNHSHFKSQPNSHQARIDRARGDISRIAEGLDLGSPIAGNFFFAEKKWILILW